MSEEIERLRAALKEIAEMPDSDYQGSRSHQCVARAALGGFEPCEYAEYCEVCVPKETKA